MSATLSRPKAQALAREMRGGGWRFTEIQRYLAGHGVSVHYTTVRRWADPVYAESHRRLNQRAARRAYRQRHGVVAPRIGDPDGLLLRARVLRDAGLTTRAVAIVLSLDYELEITPYLARQILTGEMPPQIARDIKHMAAAR